MPELLSVVTANVLPALGCGLPVLALLNRRADHLGLGFALCAGYLLGTALVALIAYATLLTPWPDSPLPAALTLLALALISVAWLLRRQNAPAEGEIWTLAIWERALWWALLVLLIITGWLAAGEALTRPAYPWDAWSAWLVKPRTWIEHGGAADFVSFGQWLEANGTALYTSEAWQYPELVPRFQLWVLTWLGRWHEAAALAPWIFIGAALLGLCYCTLRLQHVSPTAAMMVTFLFGTIPIFNVQVALPGLVDLWLCAQIVLFCALAVLWIERRQRCWLLLAIASTSAMVATKVEGVAWAGICLAVLLLASPRPLFRWGTLALVLAGLAWWLLGGGGAFQLPGGYEVTVTREVIALPYLGRFPLAFSNQLGAFAQSFLLLPNWHLLGYVLVPALVAAIALYHRQRLGLGLAAFVALSFGFLILLFFFTHASMWATSMTASNRLALHFVPGCLLWVGLLLGRYLQTPATAD